MKKLIGLSVVVLAVLALGGCPLFGPPAIEFAGSALRVDADGHFKDDIVYQIGTVTYTFKADGTYEIAFEEYEGTGQDRDGDGNLGEGWVIVYAERYDYTINADNMTVTFDWTDLYDGTQWQPATYVYIETFNAYFADSKFEFGILVAVPDADNTFTRTYDETDDGWVYSEVETYVYDPDALTWSYTYHSEYFDDVGSMVDQDDAEADGTFTMLPDGVKFRRGNTVTIRAVQDNDGFRDWDPGTGWERWNTSGDDSVDVIVITHMGDFLIEDGESSYRSVVGMVE